jgi:hypothetical protein
MKKSFAGLIQTMVGSRSARGEKSIKCRRWSLDFVSDQLTDGRHFRILTVVSSVSEITSDQRHSRSESESSRACQPSIHTTSDNGIRGSQPAASNSGFRRKCVT